MNALPPTSHLEYTGLTVDHWDTNKHYPVLLSVQCFASIWSIGNLSRSWVELKHNNSEQNVVVVLE